MKVSEIMSRHPVTVTPDQTLREAAEVMARIETGFLPVGQDDRLVGMLTDRDIAVRGVALGKDPDTPVREVMTEDVCYCYADDESEAAARSMGDQQLRRMPVVDADKRLVGILSIGDLAVRGDGVGVAGAMEEIAQPGGLHS